MKGKVLEFIKRHKKGLIILLVLIILVGVVLPGMIRGKADQLLADMYQSQNPERIDLQEYISGSGTIQPNDQYSITAMVQGEIVDAPFEEGDIVEKDQVLYRFSTDSVENTIKNADLSVRQAELTVSDAKKSKSETTKNLSLKSNIDGYVSKLYVKEGDVISAGTQVADVYDNTRMVLTVPFNAADVKSSWVGNTAKVYVSDEAQSISGKVTKVAATTQNQSGNMVTKNVTIEVKNPGALAAGMEATASIDGVDCNSEGTFAVKSEGVLSAGASGTIQSLNVEEGDYLSKDEVYLVFEDSSVSDSVASAEISLENAQNQLESAQKSLDDYCIEAPIAGTVITKNAKEGDNINATYQNALAVIYDLSKVKFQMMIDELDVLKLSIGQEVNVTADALEGVQMTGHIANISLESRTTGGVTEYPVTVEMDEVGSLLPGMNVNAKIVLNEEKNALCIPVDALMRGDIVYVQDAPEAQKSEKSKEQAQGDLANGIPVGYHEVKVTVGISNEAYVQILSGLTESDLVYVPRKQSVDPFAMMMGGGDTVEDQDVGIIRE